MQKYGSNFDNDPYVGMLMSIGKSLGRAQRWQTLFYVLHSLYL